MNFIETVLWIERYAEFRRIPIETLLFTSKAEEKCWIWFESGSDSSKLLNRQQICKMQNQSTHFMHTMQANVFKMPFVYSAFWKLAMRESFHWICNSATFLSEEKNKIELELNINSLFMFLIIVLTLCSLPSNHGFIWVKLQSKCSKLIERKQKNIRHINISHAYQMQQSVLCWFQQLDGEMEQNRQMWWDRERLKRNQR